MQSLPSEFAALREKSCLSVEDVASVLDVSIKTIYRWEKGEIEPKSIYLQRMKGLARKTMLTRPYQVSKPEFKFIDLFAGIGGFRKAFEEVGGKCVFTSEWDEPCRKTYLANFTCDHEVKGDIREVLKDMDMIPEFDVLLAGFPCQPFSIAGVSKKNSLGRAHGFLCETQGTLFHDLAQIIKERRPKAFLLENVKNLKSHDKGKTFQVIMDTLRKDLGYNVTTRIIDAKGYLPQHRERIFIVGFREDVGFNINDIEVALPENGPRLNAILHPEDGTEEIEDPFIVGNIGSVNEKYTLSTKLWEYLQNYAAKHKAKGNGFGFGLCGPEDVARTLSARYYKDGSEILIKREPGKNPRRLTPRECARLMGFDEPGKPKFIIPVSDTQAYKQFGNAVAVPVVRRVATAMAPYLCSSGKAERLPVKEETIETEAA